MKDYNPNQKLGLERNSFLENLQKRATNIYDKIAGKSKQIGPAGLALILAAAGCQSSKGIELRLNNSFYSAAPATDIAKVEIRDIKLNKTHKDLPDQFHYGEIESIKKFTDPKQAEQYLIDNDFTSDYVKEIINQDASNLQRFEVKQNNSGETIGWIVGAGVAGTILYLLARNLADDRHDSEWSGSGTGGN